MPAELNFGTAANTTKHELVWRSEDRVSPIQSIGIGQHFVSHQNEKPISDTTLYHHVGRIIHRIPSHRTFHIFIQLHLGLIPPFSLGQWDLLVWTFIIYPDPDANRNVQPDSPQWLGSITKIIGEWMIGSWVGEPVKIWICFFSVISWVKQRSFAIRVEERTWD